MEEPFTEYIINPKTGRLVKTRGKVGREVIGVDICRLYKPRPGFAPKENQKNALALFQNMLDLARPKVPPVTGAEPPPGEGSSITMVSVPERRVYMPLISMNISLVQKMPIIRCISLRVVPFVIISSMNTVVSVGRTGRISVTDSYFIPTITA